MTPIDWATLPLKKYAVFSGRAPRSEFWWYALLVFVAAVVGMILDSALSLAPIVLLYGPLTLAVLVATFIPTIAMARIRWPARLSRPFDDTGAAGIALPRRLG